MAMRYYELTKGKKNLSDIDKMVDETMVEEEAEKEDDEFNIKQEYINILNVMSKGVMFHFHAILECYRKGMLEESKKHEKHSVEEMKCFLDWCKTAISEYDVKESEITFKPVNFIFNDKTQLYEHYLDWENEAYDKLSKCALNMHNNGYLLECDKLITKLKDVKKEIMCCRSELMSM